MGAAVRGRVCWWDELACLASLPYLLPYLPRLSIDGAKERVLVLVSSASQSLQIRVFLLGLAGTQKRQAPPQLTIRGRRSGVPSDQPSDPAQDLGSLPPD